MIMEVTNRGDRAEGANARSNRIDSIDGLRALSFLAVFSFHAWEFAGRPPVPVLSGIVSQNVRPDFFVVLTGFVLYLPFAMYPEREARFNARRYFKRRLRRIVPPYYAALAYAVLLPQMLVTGVRLFGGQASWRPWPSLADVSLHLGFAHIFSWEHWDGINGSLWTMALEMQLYVLFPLMLVLVSRWGWRALAVVALISVLFRVVVAAVIGGSQFPDQWLWGRLARAG